MLFEYRARTPLGEVVDGQLQAASEEEALRRLKHDNLTVLSIESDDTQGVSPFSKPIRRSDIIYLTDQLAIMCETGINLSSALAGIASQEANPRLRVVLEDLRTRVENGDDFSSALGQHPKYFDQTYVSLVRASEATGTMGEMLERIATYLRKELETRSRVRAALAYPMVMLTVATGVTIFLITYIMPKFTPLFNRKGMVLPKPTQILMSVSYLLNDHWAACLGGFVAGIAGLLYYRKTPSGAQTWDWLKIQLPIWGQMNRKVAISRSLRTLGTMVSSGVPILDALQFSAEVSGNLYYKRLWTHVHDLVTTGHPIHTALSNQSLFPKTLVQMISSGEETGKLDQVLMKISGYYDQEVEVSIKTVTSMIEPIMITVMGLVVGGIGMALMLPIFSLSKPT